MNIKTILGIFTIGILLAAAGTYWWLIQPSKIEKVTELREPLPTALPSSTVQPAAAVQESTVPSGKPNSGILDQLHAGGSSYTDAQATYTFLYPSDYTLDAESDPQHVRLIKRGPSQRPQSELSDGVLMVFETVKTSGQTLSAWVDARIKTDSAGEGAQLTQPKKAITVNGYNGFSYGVRGLGEVTTVVVQKDEKSDMVVAITTLVADPQQHNYQAEVDAILSTMELRK